MSTRFTGLHCKEVICLCDGRRLGFVCDATIDLCNGSLQAIIVPGKCRHFGMSGSPGKAAVSPVKSGKFLIFFEKTLAIPAAILYNCSARKFFRSNSMPHTRGLRPQVFERTEDAK